MFQKIYDKTCIHLIYENVLNVLGDQFIITDLLFNMTCKIINQIHKEQWF